MRAQGIVRLLRHLGAVATVAIAAGFAPASGAAVVVDKVRRDALVDALPEPGDVIERASLPDGRDLPLDDAFDWREADMLARTQGPLRLTLRRGPHQSTLGFDPFAATFTVHGETASPGETAFLHATSATSADAGRAAIDPLLRATRDTAREEVIALVAMLAAASTKSADDADAIILKALGMVRQPAWRAALLEEQARAQLRFGNADAAAATQRKAIEILVTERADSAAHEVARLGLVDIAVRRRNYSEAQAELDATLQGLRARAVENRVLLRALDLQVKLLVDQNQKAAALDPARVGLDLLRRLEGETVETARHLRTLSSVLRSSGDIKAAQTAADDALRVFAASPDVNPLDLADARLERGSVAFLLNDTATAQELWAQALASYREHEPGGQREALAANNFGVLSQMVGDLDSGRRRFNDALAYFMRENPAGKDAARAFGNLGYLEITAGDYLAAEDHFARAAALQETLNPHGAAMVNALIGKGSALARRGQFDAAAPNFEKATAILNRPDFTCGFCQVGNWNEIGWFELLRGRPTEAAANFQRAQASAMSTVAEGDGEAWQGLGESALARQRTAEARAAFSKAVDLYSRYAPRSAEHARALYGLGLTHVAGDPGRARELSCQAARVLDQASTRAGSGALAAASFRARYQDVYHACIDALLQQGEVEAAYLTLIDARAHGFRLALEQRELQFGARAPASLAQSLRINMRDQADAIAQGASLETMADRDAARIKLQELMTLQARLVERLRRTAPDVADLIFPRAAAMPATPAGSAVVSYLVSGEHTTIFVAGPDGLRSVRVDLGDAALRDAVAEFRRLIVEHRAEALPELQRAGAALYDHLLAPVADYIEDGKLLVFSPDGALRDLPFGALRTPRGRYLVEEHPYTVVDTPALLGDARLGPHADTLLAVADAAALPLPTMPGSDPSLRVAALLPPLPATRTEVSTIARLFEPAATVLTREDASESEVMRLAPDAGITHFALHALLDVERPLDSALVLAGSGTSARDDGLLHVWEILEGLRLKADLVVLSGCDTAQGKELRGEGLVGLTRAFQFAGARAVVGSLWSVHDAATASMMERFYTLRQPAADNAQALREAARGMLGRAVVSVEGPVRGVGGLIDANRTTAATSHPYYWAAFQVYGPPR